MHNLGDTMEYKITLPITNEQISKFQAGDVLYLSGVVYTARDAAHKRLVELIEKKEQLPIDVNGSAIYYVGPTPAKPGRAIGSCGPTSSYRMDAYSEQLMMKGLKVMIGKGPRSDEYRKQLVENKAIYLSAIGGAAALISESVKKCDLVAYEDLGAEAIYRLEVEDFYTIVTYDIYGNDLYEINKKRWGNLMIASPFYILKNSFIKTKTPLLWTLGTTLLAIFIKSGWPFSIATPSPASSNISISLWPSPIAIKLDNGTL